MKLESAGALLNKSVICKIESIAERHDHWAESLGFVKFVWGLLRRVVVGGEVERTAGLGGQVGGNRMAPVHIEGGSERRQTGRLESISKHILHLFLLLFALIILLFGLTHLLCPRQLLLLFVLFLVLPFGFYFRVELFPRVLGGQLDRLHLPMRSPVFEFLLLQFLDEQVQIIHSLFLLVVVLLQQFEGVRLQGILPPGLPEELFGHPELLHLLLLFGGVQHCSFPLLLEHYFLGLLLLLSDEFDSFEVVVLEDPGWGGEYSLMVMRLREE